MAEQLVQLAEGLTVALKSKHFRTNITSLGVVTILYY